MQPDTTYTYTLFHSQFMFLAQRLQIETPPRGATPHTETSALGAIVMAAAAVEVAVNYIIERSLRPTEVIKDAQPIVWLAREHIEAAGPTNEKLKLLARARGITIDWEEEPWLSLSDLFALRNALMHYKSRPISTSSGPVFDLKHLRPLAGRLKLWEIFESGGTWLEVFLNRDCADWAVQSAQSILGALHKPPWFNILGEKTDEANHDS